MRLIAWALSIGALLCAYAIQIGLGLNPDVSWLLTVGERMLEGQQLYIDIRELNPPMSALLYLPAVWLGQIFSIAPEHLVVLGVLALAVAASLFCLRALKTVGLDQKIAGWWPIGLIALVLLPGPHFAEREHIALLFLLPLLGNQVMRAAARSPGVFQIVLGGLGGGMAMAIKPHFALAILLPALVSAYQARSLRPIFNAEHVLAGTIVIAYWLGVWAWFPAFFTDMLPLAAEAYVSDRGTLLQLVVQPPSLLVLFISLATFALYRREMLTSPYAQWLAAAAGFYLAYLIQGKGFTYHLLPALILATLVLTLRFYSGIKPGITHRAIGLATATALCVAPAIGSMGDYRASATLHELLEPMPSGMTIANLTTHLDVASPLHRRLDAKLSNSGPCLWVALGAVRRKLSPQASPAIVAEAEALEAIEREQLRIDLQRNQPDLILAGIDGINWLDWAREDPAIDALLEGYELKSTVEGARPLAIWQRKSLLANAV
ncbi:hypothetical protein GCM10007989_30630 [Devosia pacifica]|uniref:Uncharacterized protein n=1 Tax=Devosia pacifica TaxID=1335967 RepID=A0A918VWW3_9HYPH|nr:hypothetical protein [Devosia pacifica]GHA32433.1 hypothetical protein GCM10007989_30630 [Devosia pacifica]